MDWTKNADNQEATVGLKVVSRNKTTTIKLGSNTVTITRDAGTGRPRYTGAINGKVFVENIPTKANCITLTVGPIVQEYVNAARTWADLANMTDLPEPDLLVDGTSEGSGRRN